MQFLKNLEAKSIDREAENARRIAKSKVYLDLYEAFKVILQFNKYLWAVDVILWNTPQHENFDLGG